MNVNEDLRTKYITKFNSLLDNSIATQIEESIHNFSNEYANCNENKKCKITKRLIMFRI